ncbi:RICIN domain-containing protein, partial [Actinacidiphila oryziradicis]
LAVGLTIACVALWFAYQPNVTSLAQEKLQQTAATTIPTPAASLTPPAPTTAAPPTPAAPTTAAQTQAASGNGGGGAPATPKKTQDPASAKNVLLKNTTTGKCADIPGGDKGTSGGEVDEFTCNGTNQDNQLWNLEVRYPKGGPHDASLFQIRNVKDDYCMDLPNGGAEPAQTHIDEFACDGTKADNQLWWLDKQSDGAYWIRNYASNHLCLDVSGFSTGGDGTVLTIYTCSNTDDQEWTIVKGQS